MVGHGAPVIRRPLLHHLAGGALLDRFAFAEPVRIIRRVPRAEGKRVRRVHRVQIEATTITPSVPNIPGERSAMREARFPSRTQWWLL